MRSFPRAVAAGLLALAAMSCNKPSDESKLAPGTGVQTVVNGQTALSPAAVGNTGREAIKADFDFMSGMIAHHAQAVLMAGWAPTHGASAALRRYCERVVVGQSDEIALMQQWLRDHGQPVPDAHDTKMHMTMNGKTMDMLMPGMLTDEEMKQLDTARGTEFDRLFLNGMIKHHQGAITMVQQVQGARGGAQDEIVFKLSTDIFADQTTEIAVMEKMIAALPPTP
jgi:uncharacterized protein (DUF305 family)